MEPTRSSADEACSSCSTTATPSPLHSSFSSADATAVNTAAPTRRNSLSLNTVLSSPGTSTPSTKHTDSKSSKATHEGVSPKCLAQRLLQQQRPQTTTKLDHSDIETSPNTLVTNTPCTSFDKLDRPKFPQEKSPSYSSHANVDIEKATPLSTNPTDVGPAPDGGLQAWLVVAGTFILIMTNFGLLTSYGVFQTFYLSHQLIHTPSSTVSWIGSLQTFMILGGSFVFGKFSDDYGSRWVLICGSIITFVSMLGVAFCETLIQLILVQGVAFGLGGSMLFLPGCALVNQYFDKKKGTAMSAIIGAASFGGVVWPLILQALFDHPGIGFGWAILFINFFAPFFTVASYAKKVNFSPSMATHMVAIMNAASMFGRLASGPLADRYGRFNVLTLFGFASFLSLILFWPIPGLTLTKAGVVTLSITYGVASGGSIATVASCVAQISKKNAGAKLGLMWTLAAPGTLVGPVISTALVSKMDGRYTALAVWAAGTTLVGSTIIAWVRFGLSKGKWIAKV
ncbi:related to Monocarboxylate transporter 1 [Ustilago sp. UG-2017b]|nr:related to Monocarboxylate transporter 1 [Ustilago sp. UG-2017b]